MSVTSHGKNLWPQETKKRQEAPESHCRPSPPPPLLRHSAFVFTCACVHVCVFLHLYPVLAACPWLHHRRQLMLSHVSTVAAPAANNQRQLFGKYQRCLIGSTDGLDSVFSQQAPSPSWTIMYKFSTLLIFRYCLAKCAWLKSDSSSLLASWRMILGKIKANNSRSYCLGFFFLSFFWRRKRLIIGPIWIAQQVFLGLIVFCLNKLVNEHQLQDADSSRLVCAGPSRSWPNTMQGKNKSVCQYGVRSPNERSWLSVHGSKSTVSSPWLVQI